MFFSAGGDSLLIIVIIIIVDLVGIAMQRCDTFTNGMILAIRYRHIASSMIQRGISPAEIARKMATLT